MADTPLQAGDVDPDRLIGERIAGRFIVERLIGRGELSTSFRAHDERLHRRVTVKLFHPRHRDDVTVVDTQLAAARAVARLSHEHIAMVIDRGEHEGMPLVVLEHVRGENLQERIDRLAPLAVEEVVGYLLQSARALAYAHGHGIVHGNLRPANLLLTEEREVKLVDFGGGSYVSQLVGDPFAAPELREMDPDAPGEPGDDVYALAALGFVALTEQAPAPGLDPTQLLVLRPDVTPRLAATIARALATDPADRHESMRELAAELSSLQDGRRASGSTSARGAATAPAEDTMVLPVATPAVPVRVRRAPPRPRRSPSEVRARLLAWSMVVVPLAALIIFGVMIAGERSRDSVDGTAASGGPVEQVDVARVVSFDPPPGDGGEHDELVANLIDGDPATTWNTDGYDYQDFNDIKPGVGVALQLDGPRNVRDVQIATRLPGWTVEVRAADSLERSLDDWRQVSKPTPVENGIRIPVSLDGTQTEWLLLWITRLSIDTEELDRSRARMGEVRVYATSE